MVKPEYNLCHEAWIPARDAGGVRREVSMLELFRNAHLYVALAGESPTQNIAVLRLLLAVLHAVFGGKDINGEPFDDDEEEQIDGAIELWKTLRNSGRFPFERIDAYLKLYESRFWLFHPETPFYQIAGITKGTEFTAAKLNGELLESANKPRLFPQRAGGEKENLSFPEAARWLLHANGFDDTAAKPSQRGQGMPSPGAGWLGKLGLISAVGNNLFETLMLNLVLLPDVKRDIWGDGKATWEEPPRTGERVQVSEPNSQAALLTLQSRRLLLKREGNVVTGYYLLGGDFFPKENAFCEQMTVWKNNAKKDSDPPEYVPRRHKPSVQMWRDFAPLVEQRGGKDGMHRPGIVSWLNRLELRDTMLRFQICGLKYGDKDFFVEDAFSDSLSFNAGLISELGKEWADAVIEEISVTEALVREVGALAQKVARAAGVKDDREAWKCGAAARDKAKEQAYYSLDQPFRRWLESLDPNIPDPTGELMEQERNKWFGKAKSIIRGLGHDIVNECSPQAMVGRAIAGRENEKREYISAPKAFERFMYKTDKRDTLMRKEGTDSGK
ncbi:MAG: type I-E CRISPR-associated protein Cse1/CasA [Oscillospiraceae bacterium]|jgi:CRISPR system Cascade subunit CasA|nr:type I-E CRISPR-associated protein Cse1/CasA [Oscillospiraceae bacterium]